MLSCEVVKRVKGYVDNKVGVMIDKFGKLQVIDVVRKDNDSFSFESYDENMYKNNSLQIIIDDKLPNRLFLTKISTSNGQYHKGLGTNVNTFAEFFMKDMPYNFIYGIFSPGSYEVRRDSNINQKDYDLWARKFYAKNGYEIINEYDFLQHPEKYPNLRKEDFECRDLVLKIVAKEINKEKKEFGFKTINGVFVKDNVPEQIMEEIDSLQM